MTTRCMNRFTFSILDVWMRSTFHSHQYFTCLITYSFFQIYSLALSHNGTEAEAKIEHPCYFRYRTPQRICSQTKQQFLFMVWSPSLSCCCVQGYIKSLYFIKGVSYDVIWLGIDITGITSVILSIDLLKKK